jgi:hypothetical protein
VPTELPVRSRRPESNTGVRTGVEAAAAPMAGMPKRRKSAGRVPVADPNPTPPQISKVLLRQGRERALDEVPIEDAPPPKRKPSKAAGRALRPPSREEHPRSPAVPRPRPVAEGVSAKPDATDREPDEPAPASAEIADVRGLSTFGEIGPPRGPHRAAVASMSWRERLLRRDELLNIVGALLTALLAFAALWMLLSFFW